jgi:phosphoribosylaminoimidazole-succinocarboxamide synthase
LTSEELGFEAGTVLEQGAKLPAPYVEVTTKFEAFDRLIDTAEALEIANITSEELESLIDVVIKVDALIEREALKNGLIHVDGKKEFALGPGRVPVLVDSFGTLDEDRWWDADEYANGNIVQLSKEFVRQHYVRTGHQEDLRLARESDSAEPPIPALPSEVIADTAALYASMYQRLTGNEF